MAKIGFNSGAAAKREFGCMPAGEYLFMIVDSELKNSTRTQGAAMLALKMQCLDEGFKGRLMFVNLNIQHPKPDVQRIAESELREICEAVGKGGQMVEDSTVLHNTPMLVKIRVKKDPNGQYEDSNQPSWYKPASTPRSAAGAPGGFRAPVAGATAPGAAAGGFRAPVAQAAGAASAPFAPPAQAQAQAGQQPASQDSTTSMTASPSDQPVAQPAQQQAAGSPPAWMRRAG
jgi:hypothetical protein